MKSQCLTYSKHIICTMYIGGYLVTSTGELNIFVLSISYERKQTFLVTLTY